MALNFPSNPINGQTYGSYTYDATVGIWRSSSAGQGIVSTTTSAPTTAVSGDMWFNPNDGTMYVYYNDGTSGQWVESRAPITADGYYSPNYIINGAFDIWQRGTSFTSGSTFTADRWSIGASGTVAQSTDVPGNTGITYSIKNTAAKTNWIFAHGIELLKTGDSSQFSGIHTFSFYGKFDSGASVTAYLYYADASGGGNQANIGSMNAVGTGAWERYSFQLDMSAVSANATNKCVRVAIYNLSGVTFNTVAITGVQLEKGSVATPFRRNANSIQGELAACERYFQTLGNAGRFHILGVRANGGPGEVAIPLKTRMRIAPQVSAVTNGSAYSYSAGSSTSITGWTLTDVQPDRIFAITANTITGTSGTVLGFNDTVFWVSAEL